MPGMKTTFKVHVPEHHTHLKVIEATKVAFGKCSVNRTQCIIVCLLSLIFMLGVTNTAPCTYTQITITRSLVPSPCEEEVFLSSSHGLGTNQAPPIVERRGTPSPVTHTINTHVHTHTCTHARMHKCTHTQTNKHTGHHCYIWLEHSLWNQKLREILQTTPGD